jgi:hypothetical protein
MNISSAYLDSFAILASNMKSEEIGNQLSTAMLKQAIDSQKMIGDALTQMIGATPSLTGTGSIVDVSV